MLEACPSLAPVTVDLGEAIGRVLAADVVAGEDVPPFANSAVDGYAVRAPTDVPVELRVVGEVAAGAAPYGGVVGAGEAVRIMTGAPLPDGADAVAMVEDSERLDGDRVRLRAPSAQRRASVRGVGDDVRAGDLVRDRRHGRDAGRRRRAGQRQRPPAGGRPGRPGRRAVDRRRAGDRRVAAAAGADPREQRHDARPAARRGRVRRRPPRRRPRRRGQAGGRAARRRRRPTTPSSRAAA